MMHTFRSRRLAALPLALGLSACASAGGVAGPALLPSGWAPPTGQRCELSDSPQRLPAASEVVDSAALVGELGGARAGYGLFTLRYDTLGMADTVRLSGGDLPEAVRDTWLRAVSTRVRPESPIPIQRVRGRPRGWSALLRIDGGSTPTLRVGRTEECPPALTNARDLARHAEQWFGGFLRQHPAYRRPITVHMRMRVDSTGRVVSAEPVRRSAAIGPVEDIARRVSAQARFHPALLNRQPVGVWVQLPLHFVPPAPNNQAGRSAPSAPLP